MHHKIMFKVWLWAAKSQRAAGKSTSLGFLGLFFRISPLLMAAPIESAPYRRFLLPRSSVALGADPLLARHGPRRVWEAKGQEASMALDPSAAPSSVPVPEQGILGLCTPFSPRNTSSKLCAGCPKGDSSILELAAEPAHDFSREKQLSPEKIPSRGCAHPMGGTAQGRRVLLWEPLQQPHQWGGLSCGVLLQHSAQQLHSFGAGHTNIPWHSSAGPGRGLDRVQKAQGEVGRMHSHPCLAGCSS